MTCLDWGEVERNRVELAKNKLILNQFLSTYSTPSLYPQSKGTWN